ncbi:MAG: UDP-N-acetylglucosamine--N-acetylmuramyl-(pentapeptide) pyrophosphoryl-undecaprenol N-acetylglucosamine transferase [Candidatus Omnitrophica bacterium]|nr:UDP-N-acetylglucosamine--N-acetylmuramyl-(pentapeptide) pyrophosphoryl-undecaprenol N-acetylglucosamine transferase [Candidatus Omnitrophota bacterium]
MKKILIAAGPSGGHLFPAQAYAESARAKWPLARFVLVTNLKGRALAEKMPEGIFDQIVYLSEFPAPRGISLSTVLFLLKLARGFQEAFLLLRKIKPSLVVGFGSYVTFPLIFSAHFKKIPTLIHEQNAVAGLATRMLVKHVDKIAASFEGTQFGRSGVSAVTIGLPLRKKLAEGMSKDFGKDKNLFRILIVGGSQGARVLNDKVTQSFSFFSPEEKRKIAVIHITGEREFEKVSRAYQALGVGARVYSFSEHMEEHYRTADMAVTRAGANTLFELAFFKVPAIVIPYPHAGAHQSENAAYFARRGACLVIEEAEFDAANLSRILRDWVKQPGKRESFQDRLSELVAPDAAQKLVELSDSLLLKEGRCELSLKI